LRWLHHSLIHFLQSGYGWPAETSRAQAGGVAMPALCSQYDLSLQLREQVDGCAQLC
jgi:hypothetical protein